ncbi:hypothetical protein D3C76_1419060 [compost metagenome]
MGMAGAVQRRLGKAVTGQYPADQDQCGTAKTLGLYLLDNTIKGIEHPVLVRPGSAMDHRNRAIPAVMRAQFFDDLLQMLDPQVNRQGAAMAGEVGQLFTCGHR